MKTEEVDCDCEKMILVFQVFIFQPIFTNNWMIVFAQKTFISHDSTHHFQRE